MSDALYQNYKDGKLDEQVRSFLIELSKNESTPLRLQKPEEIRRNSSIINWVQERGKAFRVDNISIAGKGSNIPIRIYSPRGRGPYPVLVYFHGGGWVFGTLDEADHICNSFSTEIPAIVVSVDYRLSPENKYPCALEDAYASVLWIEKEIAQYNGNSNLIGIAGESAGANLATVVSQMARDRNGPKICYQLLICPVVDLLHLNTKSYKQFGSGCWLSKMNIEYYYDQYLQSREQAKDHYVSPLLSDSLKDLPQTHIITAEFDVLRDEGEAYAKRLLEEGNIVTYKRYNGMIHSFIVLNKVINKANDAIDDCISLLQTNLQYK